MNEENEGIFSCKGMSWIASGLLGFAAYLILRGRYEMSFILALVVGLAILVGVGLLLRKVFCAEVEETAGGFAAMAAQRSEDRKKFEADRADAKAKAASASKTQAESRDSEADAVDRAAEARAEAEAETKAADAAKAKAAAEAQAAEAAAKAEAERKAAEAAAAKKAEAAAADAAKAKAEAEAAEAKAAAAAPPERKPVAADGKPEALAAAREGGADDLKQIKGVGPKMEELLNSLGIFHFDQIAGWRDREVAWMDDNLKGFKGRVSRDQWVKQAKVLAKGGTTDFAKKVKKGGVY